MQWLAHLRQVATYYWHAAQQAPNPALRQEYFERAADHEELTVVCNTENPDKVCPLRPGHPLRDRCRKALTGSCVIRKE